MNQFTNLNAVSDLRRESPIVAEFYSALHKLGETVASSLDKLGSQWDRGSLDEGDQEREYWLYLADKGKIELYETRHEESGVVQYRRFFAYPDGDSEAGHLVDMYPDDSKSHIEYKPWDPSLSTPYIGAVNLLDPEITDHRTKILKHFDALLIHTVEQELLKKVDTRSLGE